VVVMRPLLSDIGLYNFRIVLSDGQPLSSIYNLKVTVTNTAPYFTFGE
jgi:hypothetical protein